MASSAASVRLPFESHLMPAPTPLTTEKMARKVITMIRTIRRFVEALSTRPITSIPAPICWAPSPREVAMPKRSEEHTSELQSRGHLVCRLLLEKKKIEYEEGTSTIYRRGL